MGKLLLLSPDDLLTHPHNLRRFYPENDVKEMADSILAQKGVLQALLVVHGPDKKYIVVDGNMRLAGARLLKDQCPKLKCELIDKSKKDQLISMLVTAKFRYTPDPVSEALHYRRLMDEEKYSVNKISKAMGIHSVKVYNRLRLLELEPEIQELIAQKKLSSIIDVTKAFLDISDGRARVKLAQRLARDGVTIKATISACTRLEAQMKAKSLPTGAMAHTGNRTFGKKVPEAKKIPLAKMREAVKKACEKCDIRLASLSKYPEPAWSLITHAADETCGDCSVRDVSGACKDCPAVILLSSIVRIVGE